MLVNAGFAAWTLPVAASLVKADEANDLAVLGAGAHVAQQELIHFGAECAEERALQVGGLAHRREHHAAGRDAGKNEVVHARGAQPHRGGARP